MRPKQLGTEEDEETTDICVDGNGNIFVTGYTKGDLDGHASEGHFDFFIVQYNSSGELISTRLSGSDDWDEAHGIAADSSGNHFLAGFSEGDLYGESNSGKDDLFIIKYNPAFEWIQLSGTSGNDDAFSVDVDVSGNVYIAGETTGSLHGNSNAGYADLFVVMFDYAGNRLWTEVWGSDEYDGATDVAVDKSYDVYVAGSTLGSLTGHSNAGTEGISYDFFLIKINNEGYRRWSQQIGTRGDDEAFGIAFDSAGYVYVTGYTEGSIDRKTNQGGADVFIMKFDSSGAKQ